jgi:hypothetical protein
MTSTAPSISAVLIGQRGGMSHAERRVRSIAFRVLRVQPVDATPSDRDHLLLEVVFMRLGRRYGLSPAQKTEIWRRWRAGESLHEIGRALGKDHGSIHFLLSQHGGKSAWIRSNGQSGQPSARMLCDPRELTCRSKCRSRQELPPCS